MKVIVTGASSGIGFELVKQLCAENYQVFATGRNQDKLAELKTLTGCHIGAYDLSLSNQVGEMFDQAVRDLNGLDVLINNAGMNSRKCPVDEFSVEELDLQYAVNLRAPMLLCNKALPLMKAQKSGYIVNVTSTVATRASETMSVYTAMKQGLAGFTGVLMKEAQPHGIKVTNLLPGGTDTSFRQAERPEYMKPESVARTILGLLKLPEDVIVHEMVFRPQVEVE
ncbi:SDR family oxidoreductase [Vibrio breoganii]|uniref:SDR family oxidoreductase n=1 Tax=Vibrio breoganii TaxID=553239 RepID=UPI000C85706E|nr:SDR family oxidoreductase [Vibrio breoganii]PMG04413.1 short-chain dehydrogenase [Vibrio breoganii]PMK17213.1 short-chain dehydrogenase [Vibrio breoganii]PMM18617.1 short-chain dehydrogenase [Vibrio breoganii]